MKFIPYRRDIISKTSYPIEKLLCFKIDNNTLIYDKDKKMKGRSFYILKDIESIETFLTNKRFNKYQKLLNFEKEIAKAKLDVK